MKMNAEVKSKMLIHFYWKKKWRHTEKKALIADSISWAPSK